MNLLTMKALLALLIFDVRGFGRNFSKMCAAVSHWPLTERDIQGNVVQCVCDAVNNACVWYPRVRIAPTIPKSAEQVEWLIIGEPEGNLLLRKSDSDAQVEIPVSFIEKVHRFSGTTSILIQIAGRLQWNSVNQYWQLMSEKPESSTRGQLGFSKYVDFDYPRTMNYAGGFAWCREDRLAQCLSRGRFIFYDADGNYLRVGGPDIDQILVSDRP